MTRAFVAVRPPDDVLDRVDEISATIEAHTPDGARWTTREQHHLTLQFLGNRADVDAVAAALREIAVAPADVELRGIGAFPSPRRARVLWIGVAAGASMLTQLAAAVGVLLEPLGHEPEARAYHPHLTLARWKAPTDARPLVEQGGDVAAPAWRVDEIVVYESVLRGAGAQYVARDVISLPA